MNKEIEDKVGYLLELTERKAISEIQIFLEKARLKEVNHELYSKKYCRKVIEKIIVDYIKALFRGNNYLTKGGDLMDDPFVRSVVTRNKKGLDNYEFPLYTEKSFEPETFVNIIISKEPISVNDINTYYIKYNTQFKLISLSGYVDIEDIKSVYKNVEIYSWEDIEFLIKNYSSLNVKSNIFII